ncbi:DNA-directed RNA polymerase subunit omega [Syntrophus aciditrophicus]|uniref:DNA-directed RNA polymerase subunit omega n=1 Tax=Syntrophus aciditrophicus (strain SB) TaxID=56780 RepID=RPOZ_SYNAS|nr:DNA-directed RNA polymerase subunit omega [Syntrophus aciditrophicus]Q2LQ83.1 RecName: Full=DNA-directed RNA polymerase subunit omega; Short=RNAP omega subunit; AltName: Full=RNA polymerase omega subunit; AltName: Full=Transcriptase subunit omega [Syntrophus aciditrophicus SB]ABC76156.1 RNA polymerase subunit [Syntrophus aciditrophicus SB]OPY15592.1 MAG: DNA-directed RNA polymerase subunit omega [Syntrophus sp. PtaB.Bin075]
MARITVEDALKVAGNRFALVLLAVQRSKQLLRGARPLTNVRNNREIVAALREIADNKVYFSHPEYLMGAKEDFKLIADDTTEFIGDEDYVE